MELQHKLMDQVCVRVCVCVCVCVCLCVCEYLTSSPHQVQQNQSVTARCSVLESRCRQLDDMSSLYRAQVEKMNKHVTELEEKVESGRGTEEELNRLREEHQQSLCSHKQVCMYVCMYVRVYVCVYVCMYVCALTGCIGV